MKLPAQTSAAGAWVGFIWLWNLGMLRVNTHMYIKKKHKSPHNRASLRSDTRPRSLLPLQVKPQHAHVPSAVCVGVAAEPSEPSRCFAGCGKYFGIYVLPQHFTKDELFLEITR